MQFTEGHLYHLYNRGIDKKWIFYNKPNYYFFIEKIQKYIYPYCDILAYTLMPNHFHFLIHANEITATTFKKGMNITNALSEGMRTMLSSYCKAVNKQSFRTGNLFQQNTKSKILTANDENYGRICFHYIHQNAMKAGIVKKIEDWPFSSFHEYMKPCEEKICNIPLAFDLLDLNRKSFYYESYQTLQQDKLKVLFNNYPLRQSIMT